MNNAACIQEARNIRSAILHKYQLKNMQRIENVMENPSLFYKRKYPCKVGTPAVN